MILIYRSVICVASGITLLLLHLGFQKTTHLNEMIPTYKRLQKVAQSSGTGSNTRDHDLALVYLKTHKTGSTTLNLILEFILKRYARNQVQTRLSSPDPSVPFVGGYPGSFRRDFFIVNSDSTVLSLQPGQRVDVLLGHFRFQKDEVQSVMNPSAKYMTIMRDPLQQFESSFVYHYARQYLSDNKIATGLGKKITCYRQPYLYVTNGRWVNFSQYIAMAETSLNESAPWFFRSRNYQAYDLGLDPLNLNKEYVLHKAKELDETFHLVLILDYFLESLILLKDLLCLNWEDIIPPSSENVAPYQDHTFTEREKAIVGKLTSQDQTLYDYFNASLWRKVDAYGRERMVRDVATLRKYINLARVEEQKQKKKIFSPRSLQRIPQRAKTEIKIEAENLAARVLLNISGRKTALSNRVKDLSRYMVENYGWCPM